MQLASPGSTEANELVDEFASTVIPFREAHENLLAGRLSWEDELLCGMLTDANEARAEALRIVHTVAGQPGREW